MTSVKSIKLLGWIVTRYLRWETVVSGQALESVDDPIIGNESSGEEKSEFERIAHYCRQRPPLMHSVQSILDIFFSFSFPKFVEFVVAFIHFIV